MPADTRFSKNTDIKKSESVSRNLRDWGLGSEKDYKEALKTPEELQKAQENKKKAEELLKRLKIAVSKDIRAIEGSFEGRYHDFENSFYANLNYDSPEELLEFFNLWSDSEFFSIERLSHFESIAKFIQKKVIGKYFEYAKSKRIGPNEWVYDSQTVYKENLLFSFILTGGRIDNPEITKFILNHAKEGSLMQKTEILKYRENLVLASDTVILEALKLRNSPVKLNIDNLDGYLVLLPYLKKLHPENLKDVTASIRELLIKFYSNTETNYIPHLSIPQFFDSLNILGIDELEFIDLLKKFPRHYSYYSFLGSIPEKYHQELIDSYLENPEFIKYRPARILQIISKINMAKFSLGLEKLYFDHCKNNPDYLNKYLETLEELLNDNHSLEFNKQFYSEIKKDCLSLEKYKLIFLISNEESYSKFFTEIILNVKNPQKFFLSLEEYFSVQSFFHNARNYIGLKFSDFDYFTNSSDSFNLFAKYIPNFVIDNLVLFSGYKEEDLKSILFLKNFRRYEVPFTSYLRKLNLDLDLFLQLNSEKYDLTVYFKVLLENVRDSKISLVEAQELCSKIYDCIKNDNFALPFIIEFIEPLFKLVSLEDIASSFIDIGHSYLIFKLKLENLNLQKIFDSTKPTSDFRVFLSNDILVKKLQTDRNLAKLFYKRCVDNATEISLLNKFNDSFTPVLDIVLNKASSVFGTSLDEELLKFFYQIYNNYLPIEDKKSLGITESGDAGIDQLKNFFNNFKKLLYSGNDDVLLINLCLRFSVLLNYFLNLVRFSEAGFGKGSKNDLKRRFERLKNLLENTSIKEGYERSKDIRINSISRETEKSFEVSNEFKIRYEVLTSSLKESLNLLRLTDTEVFHQIKSEYEISKQKILDDLKVDYSKATIEKAKENLAKRIKIVEDLSLPSNLEGSLLDFLLINFEFNFMKLSQYKEFAPLLRKIIFYIAFKKNPSFENKIENICSSNNYTYENISEIVDFVDHVVNQETWSNYFFNKQSVNEFTKIISTKALIDELSRMNKFHLTGTVPFEFFPTRGVLMEFSGQISDACWAGKYESIANSFPNFTSIIMVQNKGNKFERLAGACFLIEATDSFGNPILIIRGLNPLENIINNLEMEDFFKKFIDYVKETAKRLGRRPAIVIDTHKGGSASNRQVVYDYLADLKGNLRQATLDQNSEITTFNGYDISNYLYYLD